LSSLIGELSTRGEDFRVRWAAHNVTFHRTGAKQLHHPAVGDLTLAYEALELPADSGQRILVYTAEPNSPSDDAVKLLATWCASTPTALSIGWPPRRLRRPDSSIPADPAAQCYPIRLN
jgi:hypothetical protein